MAYDESTFRQRDSDSTDANGYESGSFTLGDPREPGLTDNGSRRPGALDDAFDDPAHGEPGRDRMAVHALWEVVLLLAAAALAVLLYRQNASAVRGAALDSLLVFGAAIGLLALAAGMTLRTGAPNLAIGPVAIASALHFAENGDRGVLVAAGTAAIAAAALGLVLTVLVVGFHVPGWAASLAGALAVMVFIQQRSAPVHVQGEYDPSRQALYLFGGFVALALLGGLFGSIKVVRRAVGRFRPVSDPARRRGGLAGILAGGATVLSMLFAVVAGVLIGAGGSGSVVPTPGIEWTGLALGAALLAGTSAFGRRGGVFGTVFAVVLLTLFIRYAEERSLHISRYAIAAVAVAVGLLVTRLVESYGRPRFVGEEDWVAQTATSPSTTWTPSPTEQQESWSSTLPAQPAELRIESWDSDRWGGTGR